MPRPEKPPAILEYEGLLKEAWDIYYEATDLIASKRAEKDRLKIEQRKAMLAARVRVFQLAEQAREGPLARRVTERAKDAAEAERLRYEEQILALAREIAALWAKQQAAKSKTFEITRSMKLLEETIRQGG